jgi:hypothetical protein
MWPFLDGKTDSFFKIYIKFLTPYHSEPGKKKNWNKLIQINKLIIIFPYADFFKPNSGYG